MRGKKEEKKKGKKEGRKKRRRRRGIMQVGNIEHDLIPARVDSCQRRMVQDYCREDWISQTGFVIPPDEFFQSCGLDVSRIKCKHKSVPPGMAPRIPDRVSDGTPYFFCTVAAEYPIYIDSERDEKEDGEDVQTLEWTTAKTDAEKESGMTVLQDFCGGNNNACPAKYYLIGSYYLKGQDYKVYMLYKVS